MVYQKNFSKQRQPFFLAIISSYLVSTASNSTEGDRKIFGLLAYKLLSKAAADVALTPPDALRMESLKLNATGSQSGRTLRSSGDVRLLVQIYRSQGKSQDALAILNSPQTGLNSQFSDWELVREKITLCEERQLWEELWQFCRDLLEDANPNAKLGDFYRPRIYNFRDFGNDWMVWRGMLHSNNMISIQE